MDLLLFHYEKWNRLYNCTSEVSQKANLEEDDFWYGVGLIVAATLFGILYTPCMIVLIRRDVRQRSSMKIMLALGITDVVGLLTAGIVSGTYVIKKVVFCTYPLFNYITGIAATSTWCASCWICVLLAGSRCVELVSEPVHHKLFDGYRTWIWLCLPFLFQCYIAVFTIPAVFTDNGNMWLFDPYFGFNFEHDQTLYQNIPHTTNNLLTPLVLALLYIILCGVLWYKYVRFGNGSMLGFQKKVVLQAIAICSFSFAASTFYAYVQFFPPPAYFNIIGHVSWLCCHGGPAVVYLTLNDTIRSGVRTLLHVPQRSAYIYNIQTTTVTGLGIHTDRQRNTN
ncbi:hypothetical protein QR680_017884 [Steinernema hermaphroditum]|uniref:Uncharacterized protein n=1 Tax=Steinernema hermaphroditum TaxID=289476 RepID=A0AA39LQ41_9BILA|nr:hypothetical protein QR680_017884 [Steinernema hermaphroditum]